jgi:ferredoxin
LNFSIRDGQLDVVVAAGPRIETWPSIGVKTLSVLCAEQGLTVGQLGGENLKVRGVIPLHSTGGIVLVEDTQKRIHRLLARAIVRVSPEEFIPDPFPGWRSSGLIPISTAETLLRESQLSWEPSVVILGTGNRALRLGSALLDKGTPEVFCIETHSKWGMKPFAGWEVEKRRFQIAGGKLAEAKPVQLKKKSPLLWEFKLQDAQGTRVLEVSRVISAGPFSTDPGVKEYPPGSSLYELTQTAPLNPTDHIQGWSLEQERGIWLASKIIRHLVHDLNPKKDELDQTFRKAKARLKKHLRHEQEPFDPVYQGKWIDIQDIKKIQAFSGVPQARHLTTPIASIECFEEITCRSCQDICPTSAIQIGSLARNKARILNETACTACGLCVQICPTSSIPLIHEQSERSFSQLTLAWRGSKPWKEGEFATLLNRRGESLGSARVNTLLPSTDPTLQLVQLEVPTHLIWEARGIKRGRPNTAEDPTYLAAVSRSSQPADKVEVAINGEKRLIRDKTSLSIALFEISQSRPQDTLLCKDGSCGLCLISVDGTKKLACQTQVHRGMLIRTLDPELDTPHNQAPLCPCLKISEETLADRMKQGKLQSPEAVVSVTQIGEGKCHGQLCIGALKRLLNEQGVPTSDWIDWRFPWSDWILPHN